MEYGGHIPLCASLFEPVSHQHHVGQTNRGVTAKSGMIHVEDDLGLLQGYRHVNMDVRRRFGVDDRTRKNKKTSQYGRGEHSSGERE
jgi:hypothetical protein